MIKPIVALAVALFFSLPLVVSAQTANPNFTATGFFDALTSVVGEIFKTKGLTAQVSGSLSTGVCSGLRSLNGSAADASGVLQGCINAAVPGSVVELPAGRYMIGQQIQITKPVTLRTQGKTLAMAQCGLDDAACAHLIASTSLLAINGMMTVNTKDSVIDHIIIDGNKTLRATSQAAQLAQNAGNTAYLHNLMVLSCNNCTVSNSVFKNALGATAFAWVNKLDHDAVVRNNIIAYNGVHDKAMLWADGFTFIDGARFTIIDNQFIDNTDVALIMGGCTDCTIQRNAFTHTGTFSGGSFAEATLQQWIAASSGDFSGTDFSQNTIDCGPNRRCGLGIYMGGKVWNSNPMTVKGGRIHGNSIRNAQQALNIDSFTGLLVENNTISNSGGAFMTSDGERTFGVCHISPEAQVTFRSNTYSAADCTRNVWGAGTPNWWTKDWKTAPPAPAGLAAACSADGTRATLSWSAVSGATAYQLRVDDTSNQLGSCTGASVTGPGGSCFSTTDYVNDNVTSPTTVSVPKNRPLVWWMHAVTPEGVSDAVVGNPFSCKPAVAPVGLTASCNADGTKATLSWGSVSGATGYQLRVDDSTNQSDACVSPSVTGSGGSCFSTTDYVNDKVTSPITVSVPKNKLLTWWVHSVMPTGVGPATTGAAFSCKPTTVPAKLTATCSADGTKATLSWSPVSGGNYYLLRIDDTSNQLGSCTGASVTGPGGSCTAPTDYINDAAHSPVTVSIPKDKPISWWVHGVTSSGVGSATIGKTFSCQ